MVTRLLKGEGPVDFEGRFYRLEGAEILPRSPRPGGPPIVIGGNGPRRTLPLAARYADEWNAVFVTAERFRELSGRLDELLDEIGRPREAVRRTLMTRVILGRTDAEVDSKLGGASRDDLDDAIIAGTADEVAERLAALSEAGAQRVMAQWLEVDDVSGLEAMSETVLPQLRS